MLVDFSKEGNKNHSILGLLFLVLLGAVLYSNILHAPFVFDDYSSIVDNETIKNLQLSLSDLSNNRYLPNLSFALNYSLGELRPFGYHLINNLIHIINALLLYYLVILTFQTPHMAGSRLSAQFIAFSSAFIFVAHPIQTQAVTYLVQRSSSMATLFSLLTIVVYLKLRLLSNMGTGSSMKKIVLYSISFVTAACAMKSKEIAFTLPVIAVLCETFFFSNPQQNEKPHSPAFKRVLYLLPILLTILIIPFSMIDVSKPLTAVSNDIDAVSRETANISRTDYFLTEFRVVATYLRLLVFPVNQSIDYTYPIYRSLLTPQVFMSVLLVIGLLTTAGYLFFMSRRGERGWRLISFGIFWFFITLSVESTIIPIKDVIFEHRLYLPSAGFFIAVITSIEYIIRQHKVKVGIVVLLAATLSASTYSRNRLWQDPQTLWEDVLHKFPTNVRAYNALGVILKNDSQHDKATEQFQKILAINPAYYPAYYNLGDIRLKLGDYAGAVHYFKKALTLTVTYRFQLDTLISLAIAYSEMGDSENAVATFREAVKRYPAEISPYNNLGRQYLKMGEADLAVQVLEKGLQIRETPHLYYNLARAYDLKGDPIKSEFMKQKAVKLGF